VVPLADGDERLARDVLESRINGVMVWIGREDPIGEGGFF